MTLVSELLHEREHELVEVVVNETLTRKKVEMENQIMQQTHKVSSSFVFDSQKTSGRQEKSINSHPKLNLLLP